MSKVISLIEYKRNKKRKDSLYLIVIFSFCIAFCAMLVLAAPNISSNIPLNQNISDLQLDGNKIAELGPPSH